MKIDFWSDTCGTDCWSMAVTKLKEKEDRAMLTLPQD